MTASHRTYEQVHSGLHWFYGRASEFPCVCCDLPANHWCYQYTAGELELRSPSGSLYSENFEDYAPMCRKCHATLDMSLDPRKRESVRRSGLAAAARNNARAAEDPEWASARALRAQDAIRKRIESDPEFAKRYRDTKSRTGSLGGYPAGKPWSPRRREAHESMPSESKERLLAGATAGGHSTSRVRRMCAECGKISTPAGMGNHLKKSGHFDFFGPV